MRKALGVSGHKEIFFDNNWLKQDIASDGSKNELVKEIIGYKII
jgi:hypothetical protein